MFLRSKLHRSWSHHCGRRGFPYSRQEVSRFGTLLTRSSGSQLFRAVLVRAEGATAAKRCPATRLGGVFLATRPLGPDFCARRLLGPALDSTLLMEGRKGTRRDAEGRKGNLRENGQVDESRLHKGTIRRLP